MTKQEQIEEITRIIDSDVCNKDYPNRCPYCGALSEREAKKIYDAGYRKADDIRKETAREILNLIIDEGNVNPLTSSYMLPFKVYNKIKREYRVEVEEQ